MNPTAAIIIFFSALLHVSWNTLGKKGTPSAAFFLIASLSSVLFFLPVLLFLKFDFSVLAQVWKYTVLSGFFQAVYYTGLAGAYRSGELSVTYPLARALPVIFVPLGSYLLGASKGLTLFALTGMFIVFSGCLLLPQENIKKISIGSYFRGYTLFALMAALGTTGYTLIDSNAMGIIDSSVADSLLNSIFYFTFQMISVSVFLGIYVGISRTEQGKFSGIIKKEKFSTVSAGLMIASAYVLILICYPLVTNVGYVTAFRQISIPLGAFSGIFFLKEKMNLFKIASLAITFTGLLIVYL